MASTVVATLLLGATSAGAHAGHGVTVTLSDYSTNAYPDMSISWAPGEQLTSFTIDFEAGMRLAHDDQHGTEVTPNPDDEEEIGSVVMTGSWSLLGICSTNTQEWALTWEESMTGAPAGAVAHWTMTSPLGFSYDAWVIEESDATDDYKVTAELDGTTQCASGVSAVAVNTDGTTASGGHVYRNPSTAGCYDVTVSWNAGSHSGTATVPIGGATC